MRRKIGRLVTHVFWSIILLSEKMAPMQNQPGNPPESLDFEHIKKNALFFLR